MLELKDQMSLNSRRELAREKEVDILVALKCTEVARVIARNTATSKRICERERGRTNATPPKKVKNMRWKLETPKLPPHVSRICSGSILGQRRSSSLVKSHSISELHCKGTRFVIFPTPSIISNYITNGDRQDVCYYLSGKNLFDMTCSLSVSLMINQERKKSA